VAEGRFWEGCALGELSPAQWESLCDGCALCCLHKLEDEEDGTLYYTRVACAQLDLSSCRCRVYATRSQHEPDCVRLSPETLDQVYFMPPSCAYRLLAEGQPLPQWHPLLTGRPHSARAAGVSSCHFAISAAALPEDADLEPYIIDQM